MLNNSQWLSSNQAMGFTKDFNLDALSKLLTDQKAGNCSDKRYALISLKVNKLLQWRYQQLVCTARSRTQKKQTHLMYTYRLKVDQVSVQLVFFTPHQSLRPVKHFCFITHLKVAWRTAYNFQMPQRRTANEALCRE